MSRSLFPARAILSAATLSAMLLGTACSDSTAPSTAERPAGDSPAQSPVDTSTSPVGRDLLPNPELGEPPTVTQPGPGDTATSSLTPSFYTKSGAYGSSYAPGPGAVLVPTKAVGCLSGFITVGGVVVSGTTGTSWSRYQAVVGEALLYRWSGSTWVYQSMKRLEAYLPNAEVITALKQNDPLLATTPGYYTVKLRVTWYMWTGSWVRTAGVIVNFVHPADYQAAIGATAGPGGYCRIS